MKAFQRTTGLIASILGGLFLLPSPAQAEWSDQCQQGEVATIGGISCLVENLLGNALRLIGLAAFVFIAIGAFHWLSSGGDAKALDGAKKTLTMAILGLAIAVGAWFLFALIQSMTGVNLTDFSFTL